MTGRPCGRGRRSYRPAQQPRQTSQRSREAVIRLRVRKLIGTILLLVLVSVWSLLAMAFAQIVAVRANAALEFVFYVVAGIGWVLPAMPLISWMSRDRSSGDETR
jgi:hypothetical protein